MPTPPDPFTTQRTGLQATVPLYLSDVTVDAKGTITNYRIAFLPADADPDEVKRLLANSINLGDPARCRVYDHDDRPLAGHPATATPPSRNAHKSLWAQITSTAPEKDPLGRLLVAGRVKVEWTELGEGVDEDYDPGDPDDIELLRFDFYALVRGQWVTVCNASYCTQVPVATSADVRATLLALLLTQGAPTIEAGLDGLSDEEAAAAIDANEVRATNRNIFAHLSWITPSWAA
jgi:hypothetical protein